MSTTAREYLRVSADKSGRGASVSQQHDENQAAAQAEEWRLLSPYREPEAVSASRYSRKAREAFGALLDDIETGRFEADVLILWESSRGSRRTGEWVDLIDVCASSGVRIHVTSHRRTYDPSNARDRRTLLEDAVDSEYESAKLSGRVVRALAANATAGRPHGQTPYGYRRVYDDRTGALIRQEPDPATAPHIRELFERVRAGDSMRSIERDWTERGIVNKSGRAFGAAHLRSLLDVRAYVGERVHNGQTYPGDWEPLVTRETWQAVRAVLSNPARRTNRPGRGIYRASMLARCRVCSGPLVGAPKVDGRRRTEPMYRCQANHVTAPLAALDELLLRTTAAYLARPDVRAALTSASVDSAHLQDARDKVAALREERDDLYERGASGGLSPAAVAAMEPGILARLKAAEDALNALQTPVSLTDVLGSADGPEKSLRGLSVERVRTVYGLLWSPDLLGVPHLDRSAKKGPNQPPLEDRVHWHRGEAGS